LEQYAKKDVKVVVVANPANTNCLIASQAAPSIPARNFTCLLRLDHDRLLGMLAAEINTKSVGEFIHPGKIRGVAVFGNHSNTQVPHIAGGEVNVGGEWKPIVDYIDAEWADNVLPSRLQNRGADIIKHLQASSGQSAARAISRHLQDWLGPVTTPGHIFSMGVISTGNLYDGIPEGLMFSFPCTRAVGSAPGDYSIVYDGFSVLNNPLHIAAIKATVDELNEEKSAAEAFLGDR
jgi:malate dehydrogenase